MFNIDELKREIAEYPQKLQQLKIALRLEQVLLQNEKLYEESVKQGFYDDKERSTAVFAAISKGKQRTDSFAALLELHDDCTAMVEIVEETGEDEYLSELGEKLAEFKRSYELIRLETLLTGEYDANSAILTFHAGAGGTEAQDWVEMLYRMYSRYAAKKGYKVKVLDYLDGDEAGIKSISFLVEGLNAYGFLKGENGVHRIVRISPFDSSGRRHTSFASLEVMPLLDGSVSIEIKPEELRVDTYRSGGAGGQHVNKTESAIRLTHIPTGIVVACQNERSQLQNREIAMQMLKSKLVAVKEKEHLERVEDIKGEQKEIAWGHQIRSYVFMPYTLVKDHRTGYEMGNIDAVLDGDIDGFINAFLTMNITH